jgi:hypothetical protein
MDVTRALLELAPGAEFMCVDDNYNQITWLSPNIPKPTKAQVDAKIEELKAAQPMKLLRVERDRLIAETDWWVLPDRTPTDEQLAYRQALRDLPANTTDPTNPVWPTKPA